MASSNKRESWLDQNREHLFTPLGIIETRTGVITPFVFPNNEQQGTTKRQRSLIANSSSANRVLAMVDEFSENLNGKQTMRRYLERFPTPGIEYKRYDIDLEGQHIIGGSVSGDGRFLLLRDGRYEHREDPIQIVDIEAGTRRNLVVPKGFIESEWSPGNAIAAFTIVRALAQKTLLVSVGPKGEYHQREEILGETIVMLVDLAGDLNPRYLAIPGTWSVAGLNRSGSHIILQSMLTMTTPTIINSKAKVFVVLRVNDGVFVKAFWESYETPKMNLLSIAGGWGVLVSQHDGQNPVNLYVERFAAP